MASGSQPRFIGSSQRRPRSRLGARERPEPERGRGTGRRCCCGEQPRSPSVGPAPDEPVTSCRRPGCSQMSRLSEGTAARRAAERARVLTPTPAPGTGWEQQGTRWRGRGRRGAARLPRRRDRKTEAREGRPLPKAPRVHDHGAKEERGTNISLRMEGGRVPGGENGS